MPKLPLGIPTRLRASYGSTHLLSTYFEVDEVGITVPYGRRFDHVRKNHGYVDLRSRPDLAATIPEASESNALKELLIVLASPQSRIFTVGCDLGSHSDSTARKKLRHVAGGYVQVLRTPYETGSSAVYLAFAQDIATEIKSRAKNHKWELRFKLTSTVFKNISSEPALSVIIWFFARAPVHVAAIAAREEMIRALQCALLKQASAT